MYHHITQLSPGHTHMDDKCVWVILCAARTCFCRLGVAGRMSQTDIERTRFIDICSHTARRSDKLVADVNAHNVSDEFQRAGYPDTELHTKIQTDILHVLANTTDFSG